MSIKDNILKELLSDPVRFADLFNGALFKGEKVLNPEEISPLLNEINITIKDKNGDLKSIQRFRDVIKKFSHDIEFVILACENQSYVDYAMPVRNLLYDGLLTLSR